MKIKLFLFASLLMTITASSQALQKNFGTSLKHFNNLNIAPVNDGTNDIVIASNLFFPTMPISEPTLKRVDENGVVSWVKTYEDTALQNARLFDIVNYQDLIYVTGAVDVAGTKRTIVAKIEALTGNVLDAKFYDINSASDNSRGLKIVFSNSDATNNGVADPGILVTGFFSGCYDVDINCTSNTGFVLRTDINLNVLWSKKMESIVPGSSQDYDFINGIVETNDGFLLTGSVTGENSWGLTQQGVLAHKIDFEGNFQWDSSYIFGNASDVSVGAYYDTVSDEIYMMNNYSVSHTFSITVLDNVTGSINTNKSWVANEINNELDFYGFSLLESGSNPDNLIIVGYRRGFYNGTTNVQSNPFIFEFDKATGNQVGDSYQFVLPHSEPMGDEFNFWNGQMPLMYYPDIAIENLMNSGTVNYFTLGYRSDVASLSNIEMFKLELDKRNVCDREQLQFQANPIGTILPISTVSLANASVTNSALNLTSVSPTITQGSCDPSLSIENNDIDEVMLYPNPAKDYIYLTEATDVQVQIVDTRGRIVLTSKELNISSGVYVGNLKVGMYFVTIRGSNNRSKTFKLLKE